MNLSVDYEAVFRAHRTFSSDGIADLPLLPSRVMPQDKVFYGVLDK